MVHIVNLWQVQALQSMQDRFEALQDEADGAEVGLHTHSLSRPHSLSSHAPRLSLSLTLVAGAGAAIDAGSIRGFSKISMPRARLHPQVDNLYHKLSLSTQE